MTELTCAVSAESLKLKRSRLAVIAPLFIVLLQLGVYLARGEDVVRASGSPVAGFARGIVTFWTLVFLPLPKHRSIYRKARESCLRYKA